MRAIDVFVGSTNYYKKVQNKIEFKNFKTFSSLTVLLLILASLGVITLNVSNIRDARPKAASTTVQGNPSTVQSVFGLLSCGAPDMGPWTNPLNAATSNNQDATSTQSDSDSHCTQALVAKDFNFNIPSSSTIDGIEVSIERRKYPNTTGIDGYTRLVKNGTAAGSECGSPGCGSTSIPTSDSVITYGGSTDLWDITWSVADVNSSEFGVAYNAQFYRCSLQSCQTAGGEVGIAVDSISITVYYTETITPTVDIKANDSDGPISVNSGTNVTLSWTSNTGGCSAYGNWTGVKAGNGSETVSATTSGFYGLSCVTASDTVQVNVNPPPKPNLYINNIYLVGVSDSCAATPRTTFDDGEGINVCGTYGNNGQDSSLGGNLALFKNQQTKPVDGTSGDINTVLASYAPGFVITNLLLGSLTANASTCSSCWASAFIDSANTNDEENETDNFDSIQYTIADSENPIVTLTGPSEGSTISGTVALSASATDNVGITYIEISIDGGSPVVTGTTGPINYNWDTSTVSNGTHTIQAKAADAANNEGVSTLITITVDNEDPTVFISAPATGSFVKGGSVSVTTVPADNETISKVEFYLDGSPTPSQTVNSAPYTWDWDTTSVSDGIHTFTAKAYDGATPANKATSTVISVTVDNTLPTVSINSHTNGDFVAGNPVVITADANDANINFVSFFIDSIPVEVDGVSPYTFDWDTTTENNGPIPISAVAVDEANNIQTSSIVVTVDNLVPTVIINSPSNGAIVSNNVNVLATVGDVHSGVSQVQLLINGTVVDTDTSGGANYSYTWNSNSLPNGTYPLGIVVFDNVNNFVSTTPINITVNNTIPDTTAPSIPSGVSANAPIFNQVNLSWNASTDNIAVVGYNIFRDGSPTPLAMTATTSYADGTVVENTTYSYTVTAYDAVPNESLPSSPPAQVTTPVAPDTTDPIITISEPVQDQVVSGTGVSVIASAVDPSGVVSMDLIIDGIPRGPFAGNSINYSWDSTTSTNGTVSIVVNATDGAGNTGAEPITVEVDNDTTPPDPPGSFNAVASGPNQVDLSWTEPFDNVGVVGYVIYRGIDLVTPTPLDIINLTTYTDLSVLENTSYTYYVIAADDANNESSPSVTDTVLTPLPPDTVNPTVSISTPLNGATISGTNVPIIANAADDRGVTLMELWINGIKLPDYTNVNTFTYNWDTTTLLNGSYPIQANAFDAAGNPATPHVINVTINNTIPDTQPPSIPQNLQADSVTHNQVNISWDASTDTGGGVVAEYVIYRDDSEIARTPNLSFGDGTVAFGTDYIYEVSAIDTSNNPSARSAPLSVTTLNPPDITPPVISISAPAEGDTVSGTSVQISATATDTGGIVASMDLFINGVKKGGPFVGGVIDFTWDSTTIVNGTYPILINATDDSNNPAIPVSINVTVDNQVGIPLPVTVDIKANKSNGPITIVYNQRATLSWSSSGADSCFGSGAWSGTKSKISSSTSTGRLTSSRTYTLTCSNTDNQKNDSVKVFVGKMADLNLDGKINIRDLSILVSKWGRTGTVADINGDNKVNIRDLSILVSRWGK